MKTVKLMAVGALNGWEPLLTVFFFIVVPVAVWLAALVDIIRSKFRSDTDRLLWIVVITVAPVIGVLLYVFLGSRYKV